jgi:hypothetical protein
MRINQTVVHDETGSINELRAKQGPMLLFQNIVHVQKRFVQTHGGLRLTDSFISFDNERVEAPRSESIGHMGERWTCMRCAWALSFVHMLVR